MMTTKYTKYTKEKNEDRLWEGLLAVMVLLVVVMVIALMCQGCSWTEVGGVKHKTLGQRTTVTSGTVMVITDSNYAVDTAAKGVERAPQWVREAVLESASPGTLASLRAGYREGKKLTAEDAEGRGGRMPRRNTENAKGTTGTVIERPAMGKDVKAWDDITTAARVWRHDTREKE